MGHSVNMRSIHLIATALTPDTGGGYVILKQILNSLQKVNLECKVIVYSPQKDIEIKNVEYVVINHNQKWFKRIFWERFTFAQKYYQNGDYVFSLQNTMPSFCGEVGGALYVHQPLPFIKQKIKLKLKEFLKKILYLHVIKSNLKSDTLIIVQTDWIRNAFLDKIAHPKDKVVKLLPEYNCEYFLNTFNSPPTSFVSKFSLFYPALDYSHKNHIVLLKAFRLFLKKNPDAILKLTLDKKSKVFKLVKQLNLVDNVHFLGFLPKKDVFTQYLNSSAMIFPSLIETLGLPLVEASGLGLPVAVSDLSYTREILGNYKNVIYMDSLQEKSVYDAMDKLLKMQRCENYFINGSTSWEDFWKILERDYKSYSHRLSRTDFSLS